MRHCNVAVPGMAWVDGALPIRPLQVESPLIGSALLILAQKRLR